MGGTSTLQSAVLKDGAASTPSFDLRSWQGLTLVLKMGKEYLTEPGAYAEFRNLVLEYAQQGGDADIKKRIDTIIATFGKPVEQKTEVAVAKDAVVVSTEEIPRETPSTESEQKTKHDTTHRHHVGRRVAPRFGAEESDDEQLPAPTPKQEPSQVNEVPIKVEVKAVVSDIPPPAPVPILTPEPALAPNIPKTLEEYRARIAEIKRVVHEHIGNPVALMATKDGKGKVYMATLLEALKATAVGGGGSADSAMSALEQAYSDLTTAHGAGAVEEEITHEPQSPLAPKLESILPPEPVSSTVAEPTTSPAAPDTQQEETVSKEKESVESAVASPDIQEEAIPSLDIQPQREAIRVAFTKSDNTIATVVSAVHRSKHSAEDTLAALLVQEGTKKSEKVVLPEPPIKKVEPEVLQDEPEPVAEVITPVVEVPPQPQTPPTPPQIIEEVLPPPPIMPRSTSTTPPTEPAREHHAILSPQKVAIPEEPEQPHESWASRGIALQPSPELVLEVGIDPKQVAVKQSELSSLEVTEMLDTLLHEWSIFSGSGLFGIGPGGLSHPLFRRLAPLSMGEVVAGRWEGTNPKTVKIIKQYVDAWRHEQGITFTTNETFEHYLRRVVQRILKRRGGN